MIISIDYDLTYTLDPHFWNAFVKLAVDCGHKVIMITGRSKADDIRPFVNTPIDRFLGNASFRCTKGFPSFKQGDQVYVTRRNINKTMLNASCFVPVTALFDKDDRCTSVLYEGIFKPSVDTPIQLMLYNYYKNAKFMIHSHVYTEPECEFDQFMTSTEPIPCGALEEFDEIIRLVPDREACSFAVNLRGHGCIVIADNLDFLKTIRYRGRMMPEPINQYQ